MGELVTNDSNEHSKPVITSQPNQHVKNMRNRVIKMDILKQKISARGVPNQALINKVEPKEIPEPI